MLCNYLLKMGTSWSTLSSSKQEEVSSTHSRLAKPCLMTCLWSLASRVTPQQTSIDQQTICKTHVLLHTGYTVPRLSPHFTHTQLNRHLRNNRHLETFQLGLQAWTGVAGTGTVILRPTQNSLRDDRMRNLRKMVFRKFQTDGQLLWSDHVFDSCCWSGPTPRR